MKQRLFAALILLIMFCAFVPVLAADDAQTPAVGDAQTSCPDGACTLTNPLGISTPQAFIGRVVNSVMGLVGSIALVMFVYGGLTWMTSSGSEEKVKKGRDILVWSAVGLVVVFMAYALTRFVLNVIV